MTDPSRPFPPRFALAAFVFLLAGCAGLAPTSTVTMRQSEPAAEPRSGEPFARVYTCPDGFRFSARFGPEEARLDLGRRTLVLPRVTSASGARYSDGETDFWSKGPEARLQLDASIRTGCRGVAVDDPWEAAALRGVDFRALGQEPGWQVELVRGRWMHFVGDYGERKLLALDPAAERAANGGIVHHGRAGAHRLRLEILERRCTDSMSGQAFPLTAVMRVDSAVYRGCGRRLGAGDV